MARHRRPLTRDDLLHRYATVWGLTYGEAKDRHGDSDLEDLRTLVEKLEAQRRPSYVAQRAAFAAAQQTTTVQGETR